MATTKTYANDEKRCDAAGPRVPPMWHHRRGRGGTALMEIFANDPLVRIVGVADISPQAPGIGLARRLNIRVTRSYRQLLKMGPVDLVIDVSGNPEVGEFLQDIRRMGVAVIGAPAPSSCGS